MPSHINCIESRSPVGRVERAFVYCPWNKLAAQQTNRHKHSQNLSETRL